MVRFLSYCILFLAVLLFSISSLCADPPVASYIYPAGGQRGKVVPVRVGGLNLLDRCGFELRGPGIEADRELKAIPTFWREGPLLPLPDSQQAEDYPKDMAGRVKIAADAPLGPRYGRLSTAQGASSGLVFVVGDLPEVTEPDTGSVSQPLALPVTINGRIFPREDVDEWSFHLKKGETVTAGALAAKLGSPLEIRLEARDEQGHRLAENDRFPAPSDARLHFTAAADGIYRIRVFDARFQGGPNYVYRLTLTTGPHVERVYPLGGRRGERVAFDLFGPGLPKKQIILPLPNDGRSEFLHPLQGQATQPFRIELDDLPEYREAEPNDAIDPAKKAIALPAILNGRIDKPGDVDYWPVEMKKGESWEIDVRARRLDSPLIGVLTLHDAVGKELAKADPVMQGGLDPNLKFQAPANGIYWIRIAERFHNRGGPEFAYRIRVAAPPTKPDFRLTFATDGRKDPSADTLALQRGGQVKLQVKAERLGGFNGPIDLAVDGLPAGVTISKAIIAANQNAADLVFQCAKDAKITASPITVRGTANIGGSTETRVAKAPANKHMPEIDTVLLAVTIPTPFKITADYLLSQAPRGTVFTRRYKIERNGYDGPLEVRLADRQARHLQGVTGPVLQIPAGVNEFDYPVQLPPWMETGRTSRSCIIGIGQVKDADGSVHSVSFSSVEQNMQIIVVVEPGVLGLELDRSSVRIEPGMSAQLQMRIARGQGLLGSAKIELFGEAGITAEPVTIAAEQNTGTLTIHAAKNGQVTQTAVIRATIVANGKPVLAEAKLEILVAH
ncbi:MAG TPA: hypothetical protein VKS79_16915 [Gemmataceae bacterium]|nr:hypothetical protein [Gemmataceae bacterium]